MANHVWTRAQKKALRSLYKKHSYRECCEILNARYKLQLTPAIIKSATSRYKMLSGRSGRFEPGQISWNKGKRMAPNENSRRTQFKPGNMPQMWKPVGTETVRSDGYTWVKIAEPRTWKEKHRLIWEAAHGPIPKGYAVIFMDQDRSNFSLENLRLINRKYLSIVNKSCLLSHSAELTETGLIVAELKARTGAAKRKQKEEKAISASTNPFRALQ